MAIVSGLLIRIVYPALSGPALALQVPESALAVLKIMSVEELKEAGGMSHLLDFNISLGGVLGALGGHFASFFRLRFLILIFRRFFVDFGEVWGGIW